MRWLKFLVIILGLLIVLGMVLLGFGFYKKTTNPDWKLFGAESPPVNESPVPAPQLGPQRDPLKPFGVLSLSLPFGCTISKVTPQRQYAYLEIGPTPECNQVIIVDLQAGAVLGTIKPRP